MEILQRPGVSFVSEQLLQTYRQLNLWGIIHGIYKWSHQNFDLDFDITLLTNEHISVESPAQVDQSFHLAYVQQQKESEEHQQQWAEMQHALCLWWEAQEQAGQSIHALLAPIAPPQELVKINPNL